ncbi:hypothetical protein GCM10023258_08420 [Terrabacter aeriphilus]|uniref:Uncharacterized protein n=1 Tax=Terrabacter aeriphilus TaxID=515662 RepID=A0ABP9J4N1_9MICO
MRHLAVRTVTAAAAAVLPLLAASSAAHAGGPRDDYLAKNAYVSWVDRGAVPGLFGGNVHRGVVSVGDDASTPGTDDVSARIEDWRCPTGVLPPEIFVVDEEGPTPGPCTFRGARELEIPGAVATFRGTAAAHLTGTARATDVYGAAPAVRMPVDLTFRGLRPVDRDVHVDSWVEDDGTKVTVRTTDTSRTAAVRGRVGSIRIADERSDVVEGQLSSHQAVFTRS